MEKGLFITVEGPDGAGKSTQLEFMRSYFQNRGIDALFTREPGGTPISEKIRAIILDKRNEEMDPMTEALLYAASRSQHVAQVIGPALERGKLIICDRFVDSSIVYQGYGRGLGESVSVINSYAMGKYVPDATFLFKIDPDEGMKRIKSNSLDRMESETSDFHRKVYEGYLKLESQFPERIIAIDATKPIEDISAEIGNRLDDILRDHGMY